MSSTRDDILITGAGLITCLGTDRESTWRAILEGKCGVGPLTEVESPLDPDKHGGQVKESESETGTAQPREVRLLRRAINEALAHAGIAGELPCAHDRAAVVFGTSLHGMRNGGAFLRSENVEHLQAFLAGATLGFATYGLALAGLSTTTCSACSSGLASVSLACTLLESGEADLVIAGGYDPISEYSYAGFNSMRLVSETKLRPFSKTRDGMKLAEGYAVVVLERASDALRRSAKPIARIAGFGESCDAFHLSKPHPEGAGAVNAMRSAMEYASLSPDQIDMAVAHATATPDNDASEHAALRQVFGDRLKDIPVVAFKSHLGHSLGAAGAVDLIFSALAIRDGVVPPCANITAEDIEFDDLHIPCERAEQRKLRYVLNTSLGFGGANSCMILAAPTDSPKEMGHARAVRANDGDRTPVITGVGVVLPGAIGTDAFMKSLASNGGAPYQVKSGAIPAEEFQDLINARRTRRMSEFAKLCLAATSEAYRDAGIDDPALFGERCNVIAGTTHGATEYCESYYRQIIDEGVNAANPTLFAEGVPNVASAHLSTNFGITGFCQTIIGTRTAGLEALQLAASRIRTGLWDRAIVATAEEWTKLVAMAYDRLTKPSKSKSSRKPAEWVSRFASGAVTLVLESNTSAGKRGANVRGEVISDAGVSWSGCTFSDRVRRTGQMVKKLGATDTIVASGSGASVGRLECLGIRSAYPGRTENKPVLTTTCNQFGELFSAGPLAAIASGLLSDRSGGRNGHDSISARFAVICADLQAGACGIVVQRT